MILSLPDPGSLGVFVVAALRLLVTPGSAVLYIVARSIHEGKRAGLVSVRYALGAGSAAQWLRAWPWFLGRERWVSGSMYIGLGVAAALSSSHRK